MIREAAVAITVLALLLAGTISTQAQLRDYDIQRLGLLRMLAPKPWIGTQNRWDRGRPIYDELDNTLLDTEPQLSDEFIEQPNIYADDEMRAESEKRSAVATALSSDRRRRQPAPALGKAVAPYIGVAVLSDVEAFFDNLHANIRDLASHSQPQRSMLMQEPPNVVKISGAGGGGGSGYGRISTFSPFKSTNPRFYNRRSSRKVADKYPLANHHDPKLLWTHIGR